MGLVATEQQQARHVVVGVVVLVDRVVTAVWPSWSMVLLRGLDRFQWRVVLVVLVVVRVRVEQAHSPVPLELLVPQGLLASLLPSSSLNK